MAASSNAPATPAQRLAQRAWRLLHGDAGQALQLTERAAARAARDADARGAAWAQLVLGFHRLYFAAPALAGAVLVSAQQAFAQLAERRGEILAATGSARALWRQGRAAEALALLQPLHDEGLRLLRGTERAVLLNAIAGCHSAAGESAQAFAYMYQALRDAGPARGHGYDAALYCNLSHELIELGDCEEALRLVERGLERMQGVHNGRLRTVLLVNRTICRSELGRAAEALADIVQLAAAEPDPSGRGLVPMHHDSLANAALRAGDAALAARLLARAAPAELADERLDRAMAEALFDAQQQGPAAGLVRLQGVSTGGASLRLRCELARLEAELHEAAAQPAAALAALRRWQQLQAERGRQAAKARQQAAMLQTELLQLQQRLEENEAQRRAAERARAEQAALNEQLQQKMAEVQALQSRLQELATQDALTGLGNRRHLNDSLPALLARAQREVQPLAVVVIDLDHFKRVNDTHGHPAGDQLLAAFGALLRAELRASDHAFRYGGEEFCLLMPNTPAAQAQHKVQALLARWQALSHVLDDGVLLRDQGFSAGVTDSLISPASPAGLLRAADQLLLLAKRAQRGLVLCPGDSAQFARSAGGAAD